MKQFIVKYLVCGLLLCASVVSLRAQSVSGAWIAPDASGVDTVNTWICFRKDFVLDKKPKDVRIEIAADSKYWLWINGKLVVFEGGLKRGPAPDSGYLDELDLTNYLIKGNNKIALLVWYFGKEGFSHKDSGKSGLLIHSLNPAYAMINTDESWYSRLHPAFEDAGEPYPNWRLPESNIRFNANKELVDWVVCDYKRNCDFGPARIRGQKGDLPWGKLVKREIPQWKDFGLKEYVCVDRIKGKNNKDTLVARLPYNAQFTPYLSIVDPVGNRTIDLFSNHFNGGSDINIRAQYVSKRGIQAYESLGWMNGEIMYYVVPSDVRVDKILYRETGYNTEFDGSFLCEDPFIMKFWGKALRTLYVNMRDTYFDCPDRERAQWWGDAVLLMNECFYTCSTSTHALMRKAMKELIGWQKPDGVLFSPVPAGNYDSELPGQMLASIGQYGFWNYFMHTNDKATIEAVYPGVRKYLAIWSLDQTGLTAFRTGGWTWGDWGDNRDIRLILAGWHYLALKGAHNMATLLKLDQDAARYAELMAKIKQGYNACWNGTAYRHPDYHDKTDDRVQALAVVAGIAESDKYPQITDFLGTHQHASPYMEKYIMESLFMMNQGPRAVDRMKKRYVDMVENTEYTTLFEGWKIGKDGFGGGTTNHAWSGGPLIVIAEYVCGIKPLKPGYKVFKIEPNPVEIGTTQITIPSVAGEIKSAFTDSADRFTLNFSVPEGTQAIVYLPFHSNKSLRVNGRDNLQRYKADASYVSDTKPSYQFGAGKYEIVLEKSN